MSEIGRKISSAFGPFSEYISRRHPLSHGDFRGRMSQDGSYTRFRTISFQFLSLPLYLLLTLRRNLHPTSFHGHGGYAAQSPVGLQKGLARTLVSRRSSPTIYNSRNIRDKTGTGLFPVDPVLSSRRLRDMKRRPELSMTQISALLLQDMKRLGVSIHTGPFARRITRIFGAEALTMGRHIFFAEGTLDPDSPRGLSLIAHELTHVPQQDGMSGRERRGEITPGRREELESEARASELNLLRSLADAPETGKEMYDSPEQTISKASTSIFSTLIRSVPTPTYLRWAGERGRGETMPSGSPQIPLIHSSLQRLEDPARGGVIPERSDSPFSPPILPYPLEQGSQERSNLPLVQASSRLGGGVQLAEAETSGTYEPAPNETTYTPMTPAQSPVDIESITERVYNIIISRIKIERERRGYR